MSSESKRMYDKVYYLTRVDVQLEKKARQRALILLSKRFPKDFMRIFRKELTKAFKDLGKKLKKGDEDASTN